MGVYNTFTYNDGTTYGQTSSIQLDVSPFEAKATGFNSAKITWTIPGGDFTALRLVRNQNGFPEHYEDGVVLFNAAAGAIPGSITDEGGTQPLISGQHAYYTLWALLYDFTWVAIGTASCLIPKSHAEVAPDGTVLASSAKKFASLIPRAYISSGQTYLDEIDETSDLFQFLSSMSFILDEMYTNLENLTGKSAGTNTSAELAALEAASFGLPALPSSNMLTLNRLSRQAISNYTAKGTPTALRSYCSALTGYGVEVSVSPNRMLSIQDSSFYKTVGNWTTTGSGVAISAVSNIPIVSSPSTWMTDRTWVGKAIVTNTSHHMSLGNDMPLTKAIPVTSGVFYKLMFSARSGTSSGTVSAYVTWYDHLGVIVGTEELAVTATLTSSNTWYSVTSDLLTAPEATYDVDGNQITEPARFVGITFKFNQNATYYIDAIQVSESTDPRGAEYYEARAAEVYLYPSKTNFIYNPSLSKTDLSGNILGWEFASGTTVTKEEDTIPQVDSGTDVAQIVTTAAAVTTSSAPLLSTTTTHPVPTGGYLVFSIFARTTSGTTNNLQLEISATDSLILETVSVTSDPFKLTTDWQRVFVRLFVPEKYSPTYEDENAVYSVPTSITCKLFGDTDGLDIRVDTAQLEKSWTPTDYFDGSMTQLGALYSGEDSRVAGDNDVSYLYYNFDLKSELLESTIASQIPMNTPFLITYGDYDFRSLDLSGITS